MRKLIKLLLVIIFLLWKNLIISNIIIDPNKFYLWYGFENEVEWTTDDWAKNSLKNPVISNDFVSEGEKSMEIKINAERKGQQGVVQLFDSGDLSGIKEIKFDIYNSSLTGMNICLMIKTGDNWLYHESIRKRLKPGWNKNITFDLTAPIFGSEGKYNTRIKNINYVRRFGILIEPENATDGIIYIDNVMIKGTDIAKFLPAQKPENLTTVIIDSFEKGKIRWFAAADWSCATDVEKISGNATDGVSAMKANFDLKMPGQNAVFYLEGSADLTDVFEIKTDIYSPFNFSANMCCALSTGDKWSWQESPIIKLKKGWNKDITINFKKKNWKNENSKWNYVTLPENIDKTKRICFVIFPPEMGKGNILIDNVRMTTTDKSKLSSLLQFDIGEIAYYPWNSFEKGVNWVPDTAGSGALSAIPAIGFGGEKIRGMQLKFNTLSPYEKAMFNYTGKIDFSNAVGIKFDIYNPLNYGVKITIAFKIGEDEIWYESKQIPVAPGWNKDIFFDFISPSFKSSLSNWNYTDNLFARDDIREIIISIFPDRVVEGEIYMSDIKLARRNFIGELGKYIGPTFKNNTKFIFEPVQYTVWDYGTGEGTFEKGINNWKAADIAGWGAAQIAISNKYASEGEKSMQITFKDKNVKIGCLYTSPTLINTTSFRYFTFDVYNPGAAMKVSVAFVDNTDLWNETEQIILYPGWNKNIKIDLLSKKWKNEKTGFRNITELKNRDKIKYVYLIFSNTYEGTVYVDNIRWGEELTSPALAGGYSEQDINIELNPADFFTGKVTLRGTYYYDSNTKLEIGSLNLILRGYGNELTIFGGEAINIFNDTFSVIDTNALGPNNMGIKLEGTLIPINLSYQAAALTLWNSEQWNLGTTYIWGTRAKNYFYQGNYLGGIYYNERRGYDINPDIFNGGVEQSTHIYGGDAGISLPFGNILTLGLNGEYLLSAYDNLKPVYLLQDENSINYVAEEIKNSSDKSLSYLRGDIHIGEFKMYSVYRKIGEQFSGRFINLDYKIGSEAKIFNITYLLDGIPPFSILATFSPEWAAFINYTQLMLEYDANKSIVDTYSRDTYTIQIKNNPSLALYNYDFYFKYNYEGNAEDKSANQIDTRTPTTTFNLSTNLSFFGNKISSKLLGRYELIRDTVYNNTKASYEDIDATKITGFIEIKYKPFRELEFAVNYKHILKNEEVHNNFYTEISAILFDLVTANISYGAPPFTGYWLKDFSDDTKNMITISAKGYF